MRMIVMDPRTHPQRDVLRAHVEGALPEAQRQEIARHLESCRPCADVALHVRLLAAREHLVEIDDQLARMPIEVRDGARGGSGALGWQVHVAGEEVVVRLTVDDDLPGAWLCLDTGAAFADAPLDEREDGVLEVELRLPKTAVPPDGPLFARVAWSHVGLFGPPSPR